MINYNGAITQFVEQYAFHYSSQPRPRSCAVSSYLYQISSDVVPRLEAASRRNFHCLGLGLDLAASVLLLPRGTNQREANFSPTTYYVN